MKLIGAAYFSIPVPKIFAWKNTLNSAALPLIYFRCKLAPDESFVASNGAFGKAYLNYILFLVKRARDKDYSNF